MQASAARWVGPYAFVVGSDAGVNFDDSIPLISQTGKALSGRMLLWEVVHTLGRFAL